MFRPIHGPHRGTFRLWGDYIQVTRRTPVFGELFQQDYILPRQSSTFQRNKADPLDTVAFPTSPRDRITLQGQVLQYPDGQIRISVYAKDNMESLWSALT